MKGKPWESRGAARSGLETCRAWAETSQTDSGRTFQSRAGLTVIGQGLGRKKFDRAASKRDRADVSIALQ